MCPGETIWIIMCRMTWKADWEREREKKKLKKTGCESVSPWTAKKKDKENEEWFGFRVRQFTYSLFSIKLVGV